MNRIILIGNGFDLAHGLPTKYEDFINWYWEQWGKKLSCSKNRSESDPFFSYIIKDMRYNWYQTWKCHSQLHPTLKDVLDIIGVIKDGNICEIKEKSKLFLHICKTIEFKGWVDIEREYYDLLCKAALSTENCNYTISELNRDLLYVQDLLTQYLSDLTTNGLECDKRIYKQIYGKISKNDISIAQLPTYYAYVDYLIHHADNDYQRLLCRYGIEDPEKHYRTIDIKRLTQYPDATTIEEIYLKDLILPENILLLNFNYTGVADLYGTKKVSTVNHIHGDLSNPNSIIFGYGDELDEDYKVLLKQTDTESLKNIKSIKYLETGNYRKLLQFIESAPYQVYIMGHSCGNSDRTLLNTLFEHENCVSIKPYYYQKEDGSDNYMEIVQNICRNFTDMKLMRDRVVNKTYCEPLPQIPK